LIAVPEREAAADQPHVAIDSVASMIPAEDELAIRNLAARWCDAVNK
jgi:hypothetical protein